MLTVKLWFRLSEDAQNHIRLFAQDNYPDWEPPEERQEPTVRVHYDHAENVDQIMQATPEQVKHNQGVFKE